jgi:hypothetical protein
MHGKCPCVRVKDLRNEFRHQIRRATSMKISTLVLCIKITLCPFTAAFAPTPLSSLTSPRERASDALACPHGFVHVSTGAGCRRLIPDHLRQEAVGYGVLQTISSTFHKVRTP